MGKGEIISAEGAGAYRLKILHDRERADAQITKLQEEITALDASIANKDTEISTAEDEAEYLAQVLDAKIHALGQEEEPTAATEQAVKDATKDHAEAVRLVASLRQAQAYMRLRAVACEKRIAWIEQNIAEDIEVDAWCADYNEELTGEVGTVEVGREGGTLHVIVPGGEDGAGAAYDAARDGQLQSPASSTPSAAFVNYALMPGVAKWRPRYRTGTITALDGDTCAVDLAPARSTHQSININQAASLADVPIEYMSCNGSAFEVDDNVIVEFTGMDWTAPKVVGFVTEPRACDMGDIVIRVRSSGYADQATLLLYIFDTRTNSIREIFDTGLSSANDIGETHDTDGGLTDSNLAIVLGGTTHNIYDYKYAMTQYYGGTATRRDYQEVEHEGFNYSNVSSWCDGEFVYVVGRIVLGHIPDELQIYYSPMGPIYSWTDYNNDGIVQDGETPCEILFIFEKRTLGGGTITTKIYYEENELLNETNCPLEPKKMCGNSTNIFIAKQTSEDHFSPAIIDKNTGELVADLSEHVDAIYASWLRQWPLDLACNDKWYVAIDHRKSITYVFDSLAKLVYSGYIGYSSSHWNSNILYRVNLIGFNEYGNLIVTTKHVYADKQTISYKIFSIKDDGTPVFRRESPEIHLINTRYQVVSNVVHCKKFRRDTGA